MAVEIAYREHEEHEEHESEDEDGEQYVFEEYRAMDNTTFIEKVSSLKKDYYEFQDIVSLLTFDLLDIYGEFNQKDEFYHYYTTKTKKELPSSVKMKNKKKVEEKDLIMLCSILDIVDSDYEHYSMIIQFFVLKNKASLIEKYIEKFSIQPEAIVCYDMEFWTPEIEKLLVDNWVKLTTMKDNWGIIYNFCHANPRALNVGMKLLEKSDIKMYRYEIADLVSMGRLDELELD